jgi:hypothetical protein
MGTGTGGRLGIKRPAAADLQHTSQARPGPHGRQPDPMLSKEGVEDHYDDSAQ